ncbi:SKA complex subunit 3 isoform X2 [Nothobranchius furzeri]|uniref:Spindle and kinetochore associated complex subunit 3 n=1 Tax=Nothobranchius furzeri TaxID=105023 RepID=A0A1A7ZY07_NOTFU|nr:spindle and kinetochore-associated protein 3 isoform X2 [Nothobranchius furzeri]KAF7215301.1 transcript variant X2 [Nothobranchius furzeri]
MDPTTTFFSKLRKLAKTLETETERLQRVYESRGEESDSGARAGAMRAYYELNSEVSDLKDQIRGQLTEQKAQEKEVSDFIHACRVMEQKVTKDIQAVRTHLEIYGYRVCTELQTPGEVNKQQAEAEALIEEGEPSSAAAEGDGQETDEGVHCSSPPKMEPIFTDGMQTPKLSDFGLSKMQLQRALAGADWCSDVPPMPKMSLPCPSLNIPASPPMPLTPKRALRMDDEELQEPQMHDFGISEHNMPLNNDFTMNLLLKTQRSPPDIVVPPSLKEGVQTAAGKLQSALWTPGFKMKKPNAHYSTPKQDKYDPESSGQTCDPPVTPQVPAFKTPYVNRLVSTKKSAQPEPTSCNGSKLRWECNVPEISVGFEDKQMPELPNLESFLGNSLQNSNGKMLKIRGKENIGKDRAVNRLELDGPTQEFSLGTPRVRANYQEPSTPEMPDLSSVTGDICKLVSLAQMKKTKSAPSNMHVKPDDDRHGRVSRAEGVSAVTQTEFQTLPSYLRSMTLSSLNQVISNINRFLEEHQREMKGLTDEELREAVGFGTKSPVYIVCLKELGRL